ncbi:hypothetical protein ACWDSL_32320 [Streptomyces sp. NPDC000941]
MAQGDQEALITRIQAAARTGDAAARRAWDALIALVLRRDATEGDLVVAPHRLVVQIEERSREDQEFAHAFQEWLSRYGTVAGSNEVHIEFNAPGSIIQAGNVHGNITFEESLAARPPGPPFGDDDWDDETDDDA